MSLKRKRDWSKPLSKVEMRNGLGDWKLVPAKVILEVIEVDYLHKSPCSLSFYNKRKDWNYTEPDTIRWSNHWNFKARHTLDKVHSVTNQEVPDNTWAKGIYNAESGIFHILEIYENIYFTKAEHRELNIKLGQLSEKIPSPEIIEKRRQFKRLIESGGVFLNVLGEPKRVKKFDRMKIVLEDDTCFSRKDDGKHYGNFRTLIPDFLMIFDGREYTEEMLFAENLHVM